MFQPYKKHRRQKNLDGSADPLPKILRDKRKNAKTFPALSAARGEIPAFSFFKKTQRHLFFILSILHSTIHQNVI